MRTLAQCQATPSGAVGEVPFRRGSHSRETAGAMRRHVTHNRFQADFRELTAAIFGLLGE